MYPSGAQSEWNGGSPRSFAPLRPRISLVEHAGRSNHAVVAKPIPCPGCAYNLMGLPVDHACPECGQSVWAALEAVVDPKASSLPRLSNPRGVGDALLWLMGCQLVVTVLLLTGPLSERLDVAGWSVLSLMPDWLVLLAGGIALLSLGAVWMLLPPRHHRGMPDVARSLWRVAVALIGIAVLCALLFVISPELLARESHERALIEALCVGAFGLVAIIGYVGLRGVLNIIGIRSRVYRTASVGKQRVRDVIVTIIGMMVSRGVHAGAMALESGWLATLALIAFWMSVLMLVIGQAYLVANAIWVRRSLRRPPPRMKELIRYPADEAAG